MKTPNGKVQETDQKKKIKINKICKIRVLHTIHIRKQYVQTLEVQKIKTNPMENIMNKKTDKHNRFMENIKFVQCTNREIILKTNS